jgi:putative Mn2+ efflux pump MntP
MSFLEQIIIGFALAMDCFSVSIASGLTLKKFHIRTLLLMAFFFGLFQSMMSMIGWACGFFFAWFIEQYGHWIAFALLAFIGTKMIIDYFKSNGQGSFDPKKLTTILLLAVATSIDALAVGASFTCIGIGLNHLEEIITSVIIIGIISTLMSLLGNCIGILVGRRFKFPSELIGGIILIGIGIKVLLEHIL